MSNYKNYKGVLTMREKFYVPILKWKRGEQVGVNNLTDSIKDKIIPLIGILIMSASRKVLMNI